VGADFDGVGDAFGQEAVLLDVGFCEEVWTTESVGGSFARIDGFGYDSLNTVL
jgi:hypothetical protein